MPIILDHQLREQISHNAIGFPITYFHDELIDLPDRAGPLHWHPDLEIATATEGTLDYRVGEHHVILEPGDSIFVNGNVLHSITQLDGDIADPMPNVVFSGTLIAPETDTAYQKYVRPIVACDSLPFVVFRRGDNAHEKVNRLIEELYRLMAGAEPCFELAVQRNVSLIIEFIFRNLESLPRAETTRIQITNQIRLQKMMTYIYDNYASHVTLEDIAKAADISRSEAGRCFQTYMGCSPVDMLIRYRLQVAHSLLCKKTYTLQEVSDACGFNSVNYFSRRFRQRYGYAPGKAR